jgi:hypothetical protein
VQFGKIKWVSKESIYTYCCTVKARIEIARFRLEIWKMKGWGGGGVEWGTCPVSPREDSDILCYWDLRTDKDKKKLLNAELLNINEEIVYVKVTD